MATLFRIIFFSILITSFSSSINAQSLDFINTDINTIEMNGDDWSELKEELQNLRPWTSDKFNILHIGDSHIQADIMTSVVRRILQQEFGNGGRGCIAALKLAGTNQPYDYSITSSTKPYAKCRLAKHSRNITPGVTGVGVRFNNNPSKLSITLHGEDSLFSNITLLHSPSHKYITANANQIPCIGTEISSYATSFNLQHEIQAVNIDVDLDGTFYGAYVTNNRSGIVYNSIGNNGACFSHYLDIDSFGTQTKLFNPQLIILSMGTNEAFGSASNSDIYASIDSLVSTLHEANPKAKFLLTTPIESQKRIRKRVKRNGKYRTIRTFSVNNKVSVVRDIIKQYGKDKHIPVWDLYEIAGGKGSSNLWIENGLMNSRDHVHCNVIGYELQGSLLSDALLMQMRGNVEISASN